MIIKVKEKLEGQKMFKKCKNRGPKESFKQGISDAILLSGDRTVKWSGKRSCHTAEIPPVKLPSHGTVCV